MKKIYNIKFLPIVTIIIILSTFQLGAAKVLTQENRISEEREDSLPFKIETIWANVVNDGKANPIPGIDCGWGKPTAANPGTATVSRFAVGKDGKMYTTSHKDNAIVSYDGTSTSIVAKLSPVTVVSWGENNTPNGNPANLRWNGTAITTDDAGNIVFNYCFIQAASVQKWGIVNADGTVTDVDLTTSLEDIQNPTRLDIISHIVGDVTSEEGGIGYATTHSSPYVLMFHFKGDGTTMTSVTAKSSAEVPQIQNGSAHIVPSAKHLTVKDILACAAPENEFYAPFGEMNPTSEFCVDKGYVAEFHNGLLAPLVGLGNRNYLASAVFSLGGRKYMVREYVDEAVMDKNFTTWKAVMTFGVFDIETSKCVASWMDSSFSNPYGMATLTAEPIDDSTVNIYTWAATGATDDVTGTVPGCYAAMTRLTLEEVIAPTINYNGRYATITAEDDCDIYYSINGAEYQLYSESVDVKGTGSVSAYARKGDNYISETAIFQITSYGSDLYAEIGEDGSINEAYQWADEVTRNSILANPNFLTFAANNSIAAELTGKVSNIVVNDKANKITLSDAGGWHSPREFEAGNVSFSRSFSKQTAIDGGCAGWETIALPFDVQTVTYANGSLYPFAASSDANAHRFWLYKPDSYEWQAAAEIEANVPYLIAMPNNPAYYEAFNITGEVTFSADNVVIPATPADLSYDYRDGYRITANYTPAAADSKRLVVNDKAVDGHEPGSCFVADERAVRPFEAYLTAPGQNRVPIFSTTSLTDGLMAEMALRVWSDTPQTVSIFAPCDASIKVYDITGRAVRSVKVDGGKTVRIADLPAGIYIIARTKIAIIR